MRAAAALALACAWALAAAPAAASREGTWLFVSDIHLAPDGSQTKPSPYGRDTSPALFRSALAAMRAAAPDPEVIAIEGDLLAHHLKASLAVPTLVAVAHAFATTFPHARVLLVLGNNDSDCSDYEVGFDTPFLAAAAHAWGPLVARGGAAPAFARTFAHDGFAAVDLPFARQRALLFDDTYWTPRYSDGCRTNADPGRTFADVQRAIDTGPRGESYWLFMHVPPGFDAFSTSFTAGFVDVPFLRPSFEREFERLATGGRVRFALSGHTHKFDFRVVGARGPHPLAILGVPAISPIFGNAPAFLTAAVDRSGTLRDVREHAFDGSAWHDIGGLSTLGVEAVTPRALLGLHARLMRESALRAAYARLYDAGGKIEIDDRNARFFVCAETELEAPAYRRCAGRRGFDPLSPRGIAIGLTVLLVVLAALAGALLVLFRRFGRARPFARR